MVCLNHINGFKSLDGMFAVFHIYIQCHPMSPLAPYHLHLSPASRMAFMTISLFPRSSSGAYFNLPLREIPIQALNASRQAGQADAFELPVVCMCKWSSYSHWSWYPLVNRQKTMENHFNYGKSTTVFLWAIFNSYVKLPEGINHNLKDLKEPHGQIRQIPRQEPGCPPVAPPPGQKVTISGLLDKRQLL